MNFGSNDPQISHYFLSRSRDNGSKHYDHGTFVNKKEYHDSLSDQGRAVISL